MTSFSFMTLVDMDIIVFLASSSLAAGSVFFPEFIK